MDWLLKFLQIAFIIIGVSEINKIMNKKYQLMMHGEPVPMTIVDTIEEAIDCIRAFEAVYREMYPAKADTSPYTIMDVSS
jgi:hypothetical protein